MPRLPEGLHHLREEMTAARRLARILAFDRYYTRMNAYVGHRFLFDDEGKNPRLLDIVSLQATEPDKELEIYNPRTQDDEKIVDHSSPITYRGMQILTPRRDTRNQIPQLKEFLPFYPTRPDVSIETYRNTPDDALITLGPLYAYWYKPGDRHPTPNPEAFMENGVDEFIFTFNTLTAEIRRRQQALKDIERFGAQRLLDRTVQLGKLGYYVAVTPRLVPLLPDAREALEHTHHQVAHPTAPDRLFMPFGVLVHQLAEADNES